jgi:2-iminobutanoate/2-iminopropanoate deaminase
MDDFARVNLVYSQFFKTLPPTRSCIAIKGLPKNALFEIEVTVAYPYPSL